ncbi:MAG: hypothetical protein ACYDFT_03655 [Thermoplasmata archaeon]
MPEFGQFLRTFRDLYGEPTLLIQDLSATLREAATGALPKVPQQEDHWPFLTGLAPLILIDCEP